MYVYTYVQRDNKSIDVRDHLHIRTISTQYTYGHKLQLFLTAFIPLISSCMRFF